MRVLIVKTGALGDIVRTTYILPSIISKFGGATIDWLLKRPSDELLKHNPFLDRIITLDERASLRTYYDLVISLDDELESASAIRALRYSEIRGAYEIEGKLCYTSNTALWFDMGLISTLGKDKADALKKANVLEHNEIMEEILEIENVSPIFFGSNALERTASSEYLDDKFNIGINPIAGSRWPSKSLRLSEFMGLLSLLLSPGSLPFEVRVNVYGVQDSCEFAQAVEHLADPRVILRDTRSSIEVFAAHIKQNDYLITCDSLALHLAIAQRVRHLAFFSATSGAEIGSFGLGCKVLSTASDYCSYSPYADNTTITASRLFDALRRHLALT